LARWLLFIGSGIVLLTMLSVGVPGALAFSEHVGQVYSDPKEVPSAPVAIVFGASVQANGEPSQMLADRVDAAVALYQNGKVERLLMTGDSESPSYDEVGSMQRRAVAAGVPADKIDLDGAGYRTYDSVYRAKKVFGISRAILVTQDFHLPRALYLANSLGIQAVGLSANDRPYQTQTYYDVREAAGLVVSWYEVNLLHPQPSQPKR
jgi:vancomycin permeability regulator SanA